MDVSKLTEIMRRDLPPIVTRLNSNRGVIGVIKGERYQFGEEPNCNGARFTITVTDPKTERRREGRLIMATLGIDERLEVGRQLNIYGTVCSWSKRYSFIKDYLHGLSHETGVPLSRHIFSDIDSRL